jgi:large conductance mechanosensitive channel
MPPLGLLLGDVDFSALVLTLKPAVDDVAAVTINYGVFINNVISFLIVACATFILVRGILNAEKKLEVASGKKPPEPGEPTDKKCPHCLSTIPFKATRCGHCTSQLDA